jgi:hypothetical protein
MADTSERLQLEISADDSGSRPAITRTNTGVASVEKSAGAYQEGGSGRPTHLPNADGLKAQSLRCAVLRSEERI